MWRAFKDWLFCVLGVPMLDRNLRCAHCGWYEADHDDK